MKLFIYEYTEDGFDGGTDETDHLVHWIAAPDEDTADAIGRALDWKRWGRVGDGFKGFTSAQDAIDAGADIVCVKSRVFLNHYAHCGVEWEDEWTSMCDDECPECGRDIEPYQSDEFWGNP